MPLKPMSEQASAGDGYEVIMPDGKPRVVFIRNGEVDLEGARECGRCRNSGFAPVETRNRGRVAFACPECIVGAVRARALGIPFAKSGAWGGPVADACHPSHPDRLAEIAQAKALLTASQAPWVSDHVRAAERAVADGADPEELARRMWWLPDRARHAIRAMGFAQPKEVTE